MASEFRVAVRTLRKNPVFSLTAVAVLALGIGSNSAIFGLVNQALFAPPGVVDPGGLVAVRARYEKLNLASISLSGPDFRDVRDARSTFTHAAAAEQHALNYTGGDTPELLSAGAVTLEWFDTFGVRPALGRTFRAEEDQPDASPVVILSDALWRTHFGADPQMVGRTIPLDQTPYKVVGVMPAAFRWPREVDVWVPLALPPVQFTDAYRFNEHLQVVARLAPRVQVSRANAQVSVLAGRVRSSQDEAGAFARSASWGMFVMPFTDYVAGDTKAAMLALLGAVAFVLLIACANIAGLVLARTAARASDLAVRVALGARRWQLLRQSLVESALLAALGTALGLALAWIGMRLLLLIAPEGAVVGLEPRLDARVVAFTAAAGVVSGLLVALAPAWQVTRLALFGAARGSGRGSSAGPGRQRLRSGLVIVETALAMVLLVGAGLLIRSLVRLQEVNPGFDARGVIAGGITLPQSQYRDQAARVAFYRALIERLNATPGVAAAAAGAPLPFMGGDSSASFQIEGQAVAPGDPGPHGRSRYVTPGYFSALAIPLRRGRTFTDDDRLETGRVVVIDENLARRYWPGQDPVGHRMRLGDRAEWMTVIGIVGHVTHSDLAGETDKGTYYQSYWQQPRASASVLVRMKAGLAERPGLIAGALRAIDPSLPVYRVRSMEERVSASLAPRRFVMRLLAFFALVALLMAALGLYGVISYAVAQRTREIGIRMALGAQQSSVVALLVRQGLALAVTGVVVGVAGAAAVSRLLTSQLYQVSALDGTTFLLTSVVLVAAALLASYLPARAATRIDPLKALRCE